MTLHGLPHLEGSIYVKEKQIHGEYSRRRCSPTLSDLQIEFRDFPFEILMSCAYLLCSFNLSVHNCRTAQCTPGLITWFTGFNIISILFLFNILPKASGVLLTYCLINLPVGCHMQKVRLDWFTDWLGWCVYGTLWFEGSMELTNIHIQAGNVPCR